MTDPSFSYRHAGHRQQRHILVGPPHNSANWRLRTQEATDGTAGTAQRANLHRSKEPATNSLFAARYKTRVTAGVCDSDAGTHCCQYRCLCRSGQQTNVECHRYPPSVPAALLSLQETPSEHFAAEVLNVPENGRLRGRSPRPHSTYRSSASWAPGHVARFCKCRPAVRIPL